MASLNAQAPVVGDEDIPLVRARRCPVGLGTHTEFVAVIFPLVVHFHPLRAVVEIIARLGDFGHFSIRTSISGEGTGTLGFDINQRAFVGWRYCCHASFDEQRGSDSPHWWYVGISAHVECGFWGTCIDYWLPRFVPTHRRLAARERENKIVSSK